MKENDVAQISEQFGLDREIVEASVQDGTLGTRIKDALSSKVVYDKEGFDAFKKNHAAEVTTSYFNELVDKAKKGDVPTELYAPIKGSSYQQLERDLSGEYEITEYKDVRDLVKQAVKKTSANGKPQTGLEKEIEALKTANLTLKSEKDNAIKTVEEQYKSQFLGKEKEAILNQIPFDFTDVKAEELATKKQKTQNLLKSVFDSEYKLDYDNQNRLVVFKGEEILKNSATLDPIPVKDVMLNLAKEYNLKLTSPDNGGQGGQSSNQSTDVTFKRDTEFYEYCSTNNIDVTSPEAMKLLRERLK